MKLAECVYVWRREHRGGAAATLVVGWNVFTWRNKSSSLNSDLFIIFWFFPVKIITINFGKKENSIFSLFMEETKIVVLSPQKKKIVVLIFRPLNSFIQILCWQIFPSSPSHGQTDPKPFFVGDSDPTQMWSVRFFVFLNVVFYVI